MERSRTGPAWGITTGRFFPWYLVLALASLVTSCHVGHDPCIEGGEVGKRYVAHLTEPYDISATDVLFQQSNSRAAITCNGFDGLMPGVDIPFTIDSTAAGGTATCLTYYAIVDVPSWQIEGLGLALDNADDIGGDVALFRQMLTIGSCVGAMEIDFRTSGTLSGPVAPDKLPPFLVDRYFRTTDAAGCPGLGVASGEINCSDTWVATLTPQ